MTTKKNQVQDVQAEVIEENINMKLYEQFRAVPETAKKQFSNGRFSGTDINPMWRIKKLTEMFGPCGFGWYYEIVNREIVQAPNGFAAAFVSVNLFVKYEGEWSKPIYGEGGNTFVTAKGIASDEAYKMALTDALSIAAKHLGVGADVWFENDVTKYTAPKQLQTQPKQTQTTTPQSTPQIRPLVSNVDNNKPSQEFEIVLSDSNIEDVKKFYEDNPEKKQKCLEYYNIKSLDDLTREQLTFLYLHISRTSKTQL